MDYNTASYLCHHGVKGMKWGVRKQKDRVKSYKSTSVRAAIAKRQNAKIDRSFKKWDDNSQKKKTAIDLGLKANQSRIKSELNRKDKSAKDQFRKDNKAYKKALRKNTAWRKGDIRGIVGKDLSRKYMSEAKKAKKVGDEKAYSDLMSKHDIARAKARKAPSVGRARSARIASVKRGLTVSVKTAVGTAAVYGGVKLINKYSNVKVNVDFNQVNNVVRKGRKILRMVY